LAACELNACPEGASYRYDDVCPHPKDCPHEETVEDRKSTDDVWSTDPPEMGGEKIEADIRKGFAENLVGVAYRQRWPEPAASESASVPWRFFKR
jgi:hypothetical protein